MRIQRRGRGSGGALTSLVVLVTLVVVSEPAAILAMSPRAIPPARMADATRVATASDQDPAATASDQDPAATMPVACRTLPHPMWLANQLMRDRYKLGAFPVVTLPHDLTWRENPLHDVNWLVRYQSLSWVDALTIAWKETDEARYRSRARTLIDDWIVSNPPSAPASGWAWYDQATGTRGSSFACAAQVLGRWPRLTAALDLHGRKLADPSFYVWAGNHALDQSIGLLDIGHVLRREDWLKLARDRIAQLVVRSVSSHGVTNEQAVGYQVYNLRHYLKAEERIDAYGLARPDGFRRLSLMSRFLAHATLPNGEYDMIGDTEAGPVWSVPGSEAEFAQTAGQAGIRPSSTVAAFPDEGWLFARTGWGTVRPFADEAAMSVHFGPGPVWHGHADAGSVTLYANGTRLVVDPGKYSYNPSALRSWFRGRAAHNTVLVDGVRFGSGAAGFVANRVSPSSVDLRLAGTGAPGVTHERRVVFSRRMGYVIVEDRLRATSSRTFRQRWHLAERSRPLVLDDGLVTTGTAPTADGGRTGTLRIVELTGAARRLSRGWISYHYGELLRAPIAELVRSGRSARFITILVPVASGADVRVTDRRVSSGGFAFTIADGERCERVAASNDGLTIDVDGAGCPQGA